MTMLAEIRVDLHESERRRSERRPMRLPSESAGSANPVSATVRNLSETGLMIETAQDLAANDAVTVRLPMVGEVAATVIWARGPFYGCEFERPLPRAIVSAALLQSPIEESPVELLGPIDTTWQMAEVSHPLPRRVTRGALALLTVLGSVIVLLVVAIAILPI